jgi:cytochrome P450
MFKRIFHYIHISVYNEVLLYKATLFCYTILHMAPVLFLQSEITDPYRLYQTMLAEYPVYWDETNKLWAVYSYKACKAVLENSAAHIPVINADNKDGLNEYALMISGYLVRLSNGSAHTATRQIAMRLYQHMKTRDISGLVNELLSTGRTSHETDWVNSICKKLPVLTILNSLDFNEKDSQIIISNIDVLVKIMLPHKTPGQVKNINAISKEVYQLVETHLLKSGLYQAAAQQAGDAFDTKAVELLSALVSNCIGLFIQSYDAGRGLLSNCLLQLLGKDNTYTGNKECLGKFVTETLRFDPPVHNTRRVAGNDIQLNNATIKKGHNLLIVLAAANRDPWRFNQPNRFDIDRTNNHEHLTFGAGGHYCIAKHFAATLAIECFAYVFERYANIQLADTIIQHEPLVNVRLPKSMLISLT